MSRLWPMAAAVLMTACGVSKIDYEALQKENQELQKIIDQGSAQMRQVQAQLLAAQQGLKAAAELQARVKELEQLLAEKNQELLDMQARFDKFKEGRRSAMVGKEFPTLQLDEGKTLQNARITAMVGTEISIRHEAGFIKVALAKSSDDLRWQACFDPVEEAADARRRMLANAKQLDSQLNRNRVADPAAGTLPGSSNRAAAQELRAVIARQRAALNNAHSALAAKNPTALRGAHWNSARPEDSGLINVFSERRAILGLGELDSLAASIKANLLQLHDLESGDGTR